jgi:glycosyltransferase involved in cell wall biosynthesis
MKLSVIMPVYNAAPFVKAAVESVLGELPEDGELICIDDGSQDESWRVLDECADKRIIKFRQENQGAAAARNRGLDAASGDVIAFLDADDLALPGRFKIPLKLLEADRGLAIVGASASVIGSSGQRLRDDIKPASDTYLRWITLFNSPFTFSAVTVRRSAQHFDASVIPAEDYAYCADQLDLGRGVLLPDLLCAYRVHPEQVTQRRNDLLRESGNRIAQRKIKERLGVDVPLDLVFLMRHLLAFGWERLGREHHALAFEAERSLRYLFGVFGQRPDLDQRELQQIEDGLSRLALAR